MAVNCRFDYICVIDFEATCIENSNKDFYPHEIIEFPCAIIDIKKLEITDTFHSYVRPELNTELSEFCQNLTGISQKIVNDSEPFRCIFKKFQKWKSKSTSKNTAILTDGSCDLNNFLLIQCLISGIDFPFWAKEWIDIKRTFKKYHTSTKVRLLDMLHHYGLQFTGNLHSGKDDAYNIALLALAMMKTGCEMKINAYFSYSKAKVLKKELSLFLKENKRGKQRKLKNTDQNATNEFDMDIDPELIGSDCVLVKYKHS